ncbi:MAG: DUF2283 domain-containing protein [Candidatus Nanohaloarchaeota archaeon]|nr:DUF2283 domain-containing protein [Candidatus Nanohaloarchaeota archaeon]
MYLAYDKENDVLYIKYKDEKIVESDEISKGIIVDYNEKGEIVGIEILNFKRRDDFNLKEFVLSEGKNISVSL